MSTIPTRTYDNPLFSGSSQASHSPDVNLQYIWDQGINSEAGGWRPLNTGDLLTVNIEDAQINVNLDKDEDSVNIYTNENQSINIDSTDLDIRNLDFNNDSVAAVQLTHDSLNANANLQVGDADVSSSNTVPVSNHASVVNYSQTLTANGSSTARDLHTGYVAPITKHGYIFRLVGTSVNTSITIKVAVSSDDTTFAPIDERTISWDASNVNDLVRVSTYFGEFNFKHAKVQVEMTDCTCHIQETHTS